MVIVASQSAQNQSPRVPLSIPDPELAPATPVQCRPWCEHGDGHTNVAWVVDQTCMSAHAGIDTGRAEIGAYALYRHLDGSEAVEVYLIRHDTGGVALALTVPQAAALHAEIGSALALHAVTVTR